MKPRWKIRTMLVLTTLVAIPVAWCSFKTRQHYAPAATINEAGGTIGYTHECPALIVFEYTLSRAREKKMPNGETRMVVANAHIPIFSIRNSSPEKTWSIFDFENDWAVAHIELPISAFDDNMINYLRSFPKLKYVTVSGMKDMTPTDEPYGTPSPNPDELNRLREIIKKLPSISVHSYFNQWLKDEIIVYR